MGDTQNGLLYAKILLDQALQSMDAPVIFAANIQGFISVARSITWFMKKEFAHNSEFGEWYKVKQKEMDKNLLFKFFNELRVITVHQKPIIAKMKIETKGEFSFSGSGTVIIPLGKVNKQGGIDIDNSKPVEKDGKPTPIKYTTQKFFFFDGKSDDDALELCKQYYGDLEKMVIECHKIVKKS